MSAESIVYLDSSALVKLVVPEPETAALRESLRDHPRRVSSALARVEVPRAVRRHGIVTTARAQTLIRRLTLLRLDEAVLDAAAGLDDSVLRSLDAIHIASALALGGELAELITYDHRMAEAATALGLRVAAPA
jgi:predicted nucleic acid-binding protein